MTIRKPCPDLENHEDSLDRARQTLTDLLNLSTVLFDVHGHLNDLVVCVIQQEVEVVQRRGVLVFEPIQ